MLGVGQLPVFAYTPYTGSVVMTTETLCSCLVVFVYMVELPECVYCALCVYTTAGVFITHAPKWLPKAHMPA